MDTSIEKLLKNEKGIGDYVNHVFAWRDFMKSTPVSYYKVVEIAPGYFNFVGVGVEACEKRILHTPIPDRFDCFKHVLLSPEIQGRLVYIGRQ